MGSGFAGGEDVGYLVTGEGASSWDGVVGGYGLVDEVGAGLE